MRTNYLKGRDREYYTMRRLRQMGALDVTRTYGSKTAIDIRAVFSDRVLLIQAKKNRIPREEFEELKEFASKITSPDIHVQVWVYHGRGRGVEIIDLPSANELHSTPQ